MKKLLAAILAVATVASIGVTAFAADPINVGDLRVYYDDAKTVDGTSSTSSKGTNDTVVPDQKVYVLLSEVAPKINKHATAANLTNKDMFKFSYKKGSDNSKMIKGIKLVEKKLSDATGRQKYIEIALADDWTDTEFKISPTFTFTAKEDIYGANNALTLKETTLKLIADGEKFEGSFSLWIQNSRDTADKDYAAGKGGVTLKPQKNEDNEIIWADENNDIAKLTFEGDSDVNRFYPKLSTKWDNATYAENFASQDAFIFNFISNPQISSTSRPVLAIYDPYYDYEEDATRVDAENVVIYKVDADGALVDDTKNWKYTEDDNGDYSYQTKTRQLGTYIFCEVAVAGSEEIVEEPAKVVPNTGR